MRTSTRVEGEADALVAVTAGPTVFAEEELAALVLQEREELPCSARRCQATDRRARSLSPSRRSPKLRHTNGRLELASSSAAVEQPPRTECLGQNAAIWDELRRALTSTEATEHADAMDLDEDELESKLGPIPAREEVKRCQSCFEPNRRSRQLYIFRRDQGFRQLCAQNTRWIIATAKMSRGESDNDSEGVGPDGAAAGGDEASAARAGASKPTARQQKLALKALKYRKLLKPATGLDEKQLADPSFDVLEYLAWCKA